LGPNQVLLTIKRTGVLGNIGVQKRIGSYTNHLKSLWYAYSRNDAKKALGKNALIAFAYMHLQEHNNIIDLLALLTNASFLNFLGTHQKILGNK